MASARPRAPPPIFRARPGAPFDYAPPMTRSWLAPFVLFLLCAAPIALRASPTLAQPSSAIDTEAHALFEAGRSAYNDARYEDALGYYQHSYELSHRPELLYNIGQCEDRLRHDAEAIAAFEEFLAARPDAPQRAEVTVRLDIMRRSSQTTTTTTTVEPTGTTTTETITTETTEVTAATPAESSGSDPAPWIVLGVGGAVAIVGAILLGVGYADIATVDGARNVPFSSVSDAYDAAPVLTGAGWGALGVGVALAGVGLVWGLSSGGSSSEHARLRLGPTGISVSGSF